MNCNFTNNNAHYGGAIANAFAENCTFEHNNAYYQGGAIYLKDKTDETIVNCNFVENSAKSHPGDQKGTGGAILLWNCVEIKVSDCTFVKNSGELYGGAIDAEGSQYNKVYNCIFVNNTEYGNGHGSAIYWSSLYGNISNCIFLNNENIVIYSHDPLNANNNWYGNTAINYDRNSSVNEKVNMTKWLFLNVTADSDSIEVLSTSNITFNLYLYDSESGNISKYDASLLKPINLNITSEKGDVDKNIAKFNETIKYTATAGGTGRVTAKWETVEYSIEVCNIKLNPNLSADSKEVQYSKNTIMTLNFNDIATGRVNITLKGKKYNQTFTDLDLNSTISLANVLIDEYNVTVTYSGDERFLNSSANATLKVTRSSTDIISDSVTVAYDNDDYLIAALKDSYGNPISEVYMTVDLNGVKNYKTDGNGAINVPTKGLNVATYTATITFKDDEYYIGSNKTVNITVNKLKTQLTANSITATYNVNKNLVVTLKDINGNPLSGFNVIVGLNGGKTYVTDKNGQIKVAVVRLVPKTYYVKITFKGNGNYVEKTKDVKVTVKKAKPKLTAKAKKFKKSLKTKKYTVTLKGNTGKAIKKVKLTLKIKGKTYTARTDNKGKAIFKIKKLTKKGTFKAIITFKGNKYYSKITKKVTIKIK